MTVDAAARDLDRDQAYLIHSLNNQAAQRHAHVWTRGRGALLWDDVDPGSSFGVDVVVKGRRALVLASDFSIRAFVRSSGGVFEIFVDGKLKFSKQALGRFPTDAEIDALAK